MISSKKTIIVWLVLFTFLLGGCSSSVSTDEIKVTDHLDIIMFKIGQADSIFLRVGDQSVLIDTGEDEDGEEIIDYMKEMGLIRLII